MVVTSHTAVCVRVRACAAEGMYIFNLKNK